MDKKSILEDANTVINGDRQDSYGNPEDSFHLISRLWSEYLQARQKMNDNIFTLDKLDVAHMMALFKIARMVGQKPCRDNYVDAAGYLAIVADRFLDCSKKEPGGTK